MKCSQQYSWETGSEAGTGPVTKMIAPWASLQCLQKWLITTTGARLSLQLLQFPPGDCSVCSVLVLFAFLFFTRTPHHHPSPSLSSRVLLSRMAEAELHKERLQAIAVSQFHFTCSFVHSRGLWREAGISAGWLGSAWRAWLPQSCAWSSPFGKRVVKVCFAGFGGERGLWGRALRWHVRKEKWECTVARLKEWWWRRKEGISGEDGRFREKIGTLLKRYFLTVWALA